MGVAVPDLSPAARLLGDGWFLLCRDEAHGMWKWGGDGKWAARNNPSLRRVTLMWQAARGTVCVARRLTLMAGEVATPMSVPANLHCTPHSARAQVPLGDNSKTKGVNKKKACFA